MTQKSREEQKPTPKSETNEGQISKVAADPEVISLDAYLEKHSVHPGLIASYRYEARASEEMLLEKTESAWKLAFEQQSKTQY
ncbi:hypothetical protein [Paenibacillus graminis]|uniref:hypothetical protein n=1 Tax=Paenibacillus graminis TaxID=189425 RepID=UPI002DBB55F3|nr:hypothetical protein [Paenibacillus graminis]MEC0169913.1 hypothetical protein [Paenibacillus graminis]